MEIQSLWRRHDTWQRRDEIVFQSCEIFHVAEVRHCDVDERSAWDGDAADASDRVDEFVGASHAWKLTWPIDIDVW